MKWVIYELSKMRRVGVYPNRIAALNMVHRLHQDIAEARYTIKQEA